MAVPTNGLMLISPLTQANPTLHSSETSRGGLLSCFQISPDVPVLRSWAGIVEQSPDYMPIIDFAGSPENYIVVTASAHGFGIAPATGKAVSDMVLHGESSIDITGLGLDRFADISRPTGAQKEAGVPTPTNGGFCNS